MRKLIVGAILAIVALPVPAKADNVVTQFTWDRTGSEHLPCAGSVQWLLSPGTGLLDATVGINDDDGVDDGHAYGMLYAWTTDTFYITTTEALQPSDEVLVAFTGEAVTQPTLSLVDCTQAVTEPPVIPTTNPPPTLPTESSPLPTLVHFDIGYTVRTIKRTNVVVKWRLRCWNDTSTVTRHRKIHAQTPLHHELPPTFVEATSCHLRVIAWDIPPHARPHNWPAPVVTTWVEVA